MPGSDWLIILTEYIALLSTATSGTIVAIERRLDMVGVWFLALISSFGGGVLRDVLLGDTPPRFFTNYRWLLVVTIVSMAVFFIAKFWRGWWDRRVRTYTEQVNNILDAIGLAAFTLSGVHLACAAGYENNPFLCVFMGTITGIGGGVLRDISVMQTPSVLRKRVYAMASILGGIIYWGMMHFALSAELSWAVSMVVIIAIRICATIFRWNMPSIPIPEEQFKTEREKETINK